MKALTDEQWQEIRKMEPCAYSEDDYEQALSIVLQQHDHLAAQIKLLADYIMGERPDDPAWKLDEGACAMAVEIMKREGDVEIAYKGLQEHKDFLANENQKLRTQLAKNEAVEHEECILCEGTGEGIDENDKWPCDECDGSGLVPVE